MHSNQTTKSYYSSPKHESTLIDLQYNFLTSVALCTIIWILWGFPTDVQWHQPSVRKSYKITMRIIQLSRNIQRENITSFETKKKVVHNSYEVKSYEQRKSPTIQYIRGMRGDRGVPKKYKKSRKGEYHVALMKRILKILQRLEILWSYNPFKFMALEYFTCPQVIPPHRCCCTWRHRVEVFSPLHLPHLC